MTLLDSLDQMTETLLAPRAPEIDETAQFPQDVVHAAAEIGLQRVLLDEHGNLDTTRAVIVPEISERLATYSMASAVAVSNARLTSYLLMKYASEDVAQQWVEPTLAGEKFGAFAITEATAGTDVRAMQSVARRVGDEYILSGEKSWVGYAPNGHYAIVLAKENSADRDAPMVALVVDTTQAGVSQTHGPQLSGLRGMPNGSLTFRDVRVPASSRLSVDGFGGMMDGLNMARIDAAAYACGLLRGALLSSLERASTREAFGGSLADIQAIQRKLGHMATDYQAARLLTRRAAESFACGTSGDQDIISMAKMYASGAAHQHTDEAVQIFGAQGMVRSTWVNRLNRDAKVTQIFDGTSEIHENMLGRRAAKKFAAGGELDAFLGRSA